MLNLRVSTQPFYGFWNEESLIFMNVITYQCRYISYFLQLNYQVYFNVEDNFMARYSILGEGS